MKELVDSLTKRGVLKTPAIIRAFGAVDRSHFVKPGSVDDALSDEPLAIGYGQTISQPFTVAFMLELLQPEVGDRVLDVGSGSAWTSALLSELVGPNGKVFAVELIPQLKTFGEENLKREGYASVQVFAGDGSRGLSEFAPFKRILVSAAAHGIPQALRDQLSVGGRLVIPVGPYVQDMVLVEKLGKGNFREQRYPGFQFVPLVVR